MLTQNQDKSTNGKSLDFPNPCGNKKRIFSADGTIEEEAENINGYLLDAAVMSAYGFKADMSEAEIVEELFKMYEKICAKS